ncbi:hypothetical protein NLG97_g398 [Lecanicillium saksenae]|uniref:Uncharacterized protein n=1 Tax=Lecanicillium saksenae TaxID=468837 RepID=A0ACC1RA47_9HYPO|nr:hypothetical protein NLG97_g398 [Lecanicillium saksenae]
MTTHCAASPTFQSRLTPTSSACPNSSSFNKGTIMRHGSGITLALASLTLVTHAQVDLDMDDVPMACKPICKPIGDLSNKCDIDLASDNDNDEHHLQNQCICTNDSFNVAKIAALCAACMHGSKRYKRGGSRADNIDGVLSLCGFPSTTYNAAATGEAESITVQVNTPTAISQLTTTIDKSHLGSGGASLTRGGGARMGNTNSPNSGGARSAAYLMG